MSVSVQNTPEKGRYEVYDGDRLAGIVTYHLDPGRITFDHAEVNSDSGGKGMGKRLVRGALDDARRQGLAVLPACPYVRKVISKHPDDYLDLVPEEDRERFDLSR